MSHVFCPQQSSIVLTTCHCPYTTYVIPISPPEIHSGQAYCILLALTHVYTNWIPLPPHLLDLEILVLLQQCVPKFAQPSALLSSCAGANLPGYIDCLKTKCCLALVTLPVAWCWYKEIIHATPFPSDKYQ